MGSKYNYNKKDNKSFVQSKDNTDDTCEEGLIGGGFHWKCSFTNCVMCPGVYSDGHFKIVCECDCHKIEKHFEEVKIRYVFPQ
jgi:hypothetical protein